MNEKQEALAIPEAKDLLAMNRPPATILKEARDAAIALTGVIEAKVDKVRFNNKTYLTFEDWQTLGRFYGVTAVATSTRYIEFGALTGGAVRGFEARADAILVATGQVISSADAMCLNDEEKWSERAKYRYENGRRVLVGTVAVPLFQLRSMAQTRACAKALRNVLSWVVVMAGYSGTPAEEMTDEEYMQEEPARRPPSAAKKKKTNDKPTPAEWEQPPDEQEDVTAFKGPERILPFQKNAFLEACAKTHKTEQQKLDYYGSLGFEELDEMPKDKFKEALQWAMEK
jgi:hypothetical protein